MSGQGTSKSKKKHGNENSSGSSSSAHNQTSKRGQVYNTANVGLDVLANIAEGSDILAPLKAACRTTQSILGVVQAIENNQQEWVDLIQRLKDYTSALEERIVLIEAYPVEGRAIDKAVRQPLVHYVEFLQTMHDTVINLQAKRDRKRGFFKSFSKMKIDAGEILKLNRDIEERHRHLIEALGVFTAVHVQVIEESTKVIEESTKVIEKNTKVIEENTKVLLTDADASAMLQLPIVAFAASSVHRTCLKGTREAVLQTIWRWANDDTSEKPIFWLCDIAGSGKSTVAMSVAESWREKGVLGGRFFFSISSSEASTTEKFCSTIARDLVHHIPELAPDVAGAVKRNLSVMRSSLDEQFKTLITDPLLCRQGRVILVIDALDECKSTSQRRELVETLSTAVQANKNLTIFMTSRPDPVIDAVLGPLSIKSKLEDRLHDVRHSDNIGDITIYVHQSLDGILSKEKRQKLIDKSNGLFIWASTACRVLSDYTSLIPAESTYNRLVSIDQAGAIDDLYSLIFERVAPEYHAVMYQMLALLLAAFEPLTADDLDDILKHARVEGSASALVRNLGSVLTEDGATKQIQFRHPTLVEYLRRCSSNPTVEAHNKVYIDMANAHGRAASWCFKSLQSRSEGLKFNICQLESSFYLNREIPNLDAKVSKFISRRLRYASSHWPFHAAETNDNWRSILKKELHNIIQVPHVLYWMEILSFIGGVPRAITGLRAIPRQRLEEEVQNGINEIQRFLMAFSVPIQDSAPHIYISALPFTPTKSNLHIEGLKMHRNTLEVTRGLEATYPGLPIALRGHQDSVYAVGFSPDGSRIVSGSSDNTIRLWDANTGQSLGEPLRGHQGWVYAVGFSPDGSRIVSGSSDMTIRLWDANTGHSLGEPLRGHQGSVYAVGFSPDGTQIISGSQDKTIQVWNTDTDANGDSPGQDDRELSESSYLGIAVPGFMHCSLSQDGWVLSSGKRLFWVPPENRYGLLNPRLLLNIPTTTFFRATKLDFTRFRCGLSWTNVRTDAHL